VKKRSKSAARLREMFMADPASAALTAASLRA
jgi:hypothetical protein